MIARLRGRLDSVGADHAVVDCGGVGYLVFCSRRTLGRLGGAGEAVALHVETQVREDAIQLFGFADPAERDWFRLLTTVQGVGARVALSILSVLDPDALALAIAAQDRKALTRADGVGPKLAGRIASELKDRVGSIARPVAFAAAGSGGAGEGTQADGGAEDAVTADVVSALVNLGYARAEAFSAVARARSTAGAPDGVAALIPAALRLLAPAERRR